MKAILEVGIKDLKIQFVELIAALFKQKVTEIVVHKHNVNLEEFDKTITFDAVTQSLKNNGHNELLINEIEKGLRNSSGYSKE